MSATFFLGRGTSRASLTRSSDSVRDTNTLEDLPVGLFGSAMSVSGLSAAWQLAHVRYGAPEGIALAIGGLALVAFVLLSTSYALKLVAASTAVREEFRHPVTSHLFGTIPISLLQLPIVIEPFAHGLALALWITGAIGAVFFAGLILSRWASDRLGSAHATPACIIPFVGVLTLPLALPVLGLPNVHSLMVAALAVGLSFAVLLFALIFSRLPFEPPLPVALKPSLLILVAPFAVGYSSYTVTAGRTDLFAEALFTLTLFLLVVLLGHLRHLPACCRFRVSWWAASFPLAACSVAALRFAGARPGVIPDMIALALLTLATLVVAGLLVGTLADIGKSRFAGLHREHESFWRDRAGWN